MGEIPRQGQEEIMAFAKQPDWMTKMKNKLDAEQKLIDKVALRPEVKAIPSLFYCGWLPESTDEERRIKIETLTLNPNCCFNHFIGLPTLKFEDPETHEEYESDPVPLYEYEHQIIHDVEKYQFYALNKSRGIGATELIIRHILFRAVFNTVPDRKWLVVAGIRMEHSREFLHRIKNLADKIPWIYKVQPTEYPTNLFVNESIIKALPADSRTIRSFDNVAMVFLDESAYWNILDDTPVLTASESHVAKSGAHIVVVSTPNGQRGFFWQIFSAKKTIYKRETLNWQVAVNQPIPLLIADVIRKLQENDPYKYEQEHNCQFLASKYQAIPDVVLDKLVEFGEDYALRD